MTTYAIEEKWKRVAFNPNFSVSNHGRVKNKNGELLSVVVYPGSPYPLLSLSGRRSRLHRLVAEAFLPRVMGKFHVHHKDHNPLNNCVDNLEWVTPKQNTCYAAKAGRLSVKRNSGLDHPRCRKVIQKSVPDLAEIKVWGSMTEAAQALGLQQNAINVAALKNSKGPKHFPHSAGGFVWEYVQ